MNSETNVGKFELLASDGHQITRVYDNDFAFLNRVARKYNTYRIINTENNRILVESANDVKAFVGAMVIFNLVQNGNVMYFNDASLHMRDNGTYRVLEYRVNTVHIEADFTSFNEAYDLYNEIGDYSENR